MSLNQTSYNAALLSLLLGYSSSATSFGDQWYLGIGGGTSLLRPAPSASTIGVELEDDQDSNATLYFGRDFDDRSSAQFQLYSLGEATFSNANTVTYNAGDATVLYRFYDSRGSWNESSIAISLYGRLGLGYIERKSAVALKNNKSAYFGAGAGMETYFTRNLGVRLEAFYHEVDTASLSLSLVSRFGGVERPKAPPKPFLSPTPTPKEKPFNSDKTYTAEAPQLPRNPLKNTVAPPVESLADTENTFYPKQTAFNNDNDADGVLNSSDRCPTTLEGYPVDNTGCSLFTKIAKGMTFVESSPNLTTDVINELNQLALILKQFPDAGVELIAHTDNRGTEASQSRLTEQRLRNIGVYLLKRGVMKSQLLLRSFAGKRPAFDNITADGRRANNRIEARELDKSRRR